MCGSSFFLHCSLSHCGALCMWLFMYTCTTHLLQNISNFEQLLVIEASKLWHTVTDDDISVLAFIYVTIWHTCTCICIHICTCTCTHTRIDTTFMHTLCWDNKKYSVYQPFEEFNVLRLSHYASVHHDCLKRGTVQCPHLVRQGNWCQGRCTIHIHVFSGSAGRASA